MPETLTFLEFRIPAGIDVLFRGDEAVPLEPRPVQVLRYLAEHNDRVVSKQELLDHIWSDVFTTEGVLKRAISQCRQALGDDRAEPRFIETHHGRGYRFLAPVVRETEAASRTAPPVRNLPAETTSFVGRERDLEALDRLFDSARLVTLTGAGGIGKTRLALRLARRIADRFERGAAFVGLESLADPALVPGAVAAALGVGEEPGRPVAETLAEALRDTALLVVLDNCEHLVDACAAFVSNLLEATSRIVVLATSREPLAVSGEAVRRVEVLDTPEGEPVEATRASEAGRLFVDRARLISADFDVTQENAAAVAAICMQLEGIPLAIELAAARIGALSAEEIAARLTDRFGLLTRGDRTAPARRKTMRAAIDWSYELLTESEQRLLRALSVFSGFDLEAAEALMREAGAADGDEPVLDLVARLVDKSLVVADPRAGRTRYRLLETIRQYAAGKLAEAEETAAVAAAHARWAAALVERASAEYRGPREKAWLDRLSAEHDNLREALRWGRAAGGGGAFLVPLCANLARFWDVRGHWDEGREWAEEALGESGGAEPAARAKLLFGAGLLARQQGDNPAARTRFTEALELYRDLGDDRGRATVLNAMGNLYEAAGDYASSVAAQAESHALFERLGDDRGRAMALSGLGMLALDAEDYDLAAEHYEESLTISRRIGDLVSAGIMLHNLGDIAARRGEAERAEALLEESIELAGELGFQSLAAHSLLRLGDMAVDAGDADRAEDLYRRVLDIGRELGDRTRLVYLLEGFARAAALRGDARRALMLAGAAEVLREALNAPLNPDEERALAESLTPAHLALGEEAARAAFDEGRAMRRDEAFAIVVSSQ